MDDKGPHLNCRRETDDKEGEETTSKEAQPETPESGGGEVKNEEANDAKEVSGETEP